MFDASSPRAYHASPKLKTSAVTEIELAYGGRPALVYHSSQAYNGRAAMKSPPHTPSNAGCEKICPETRVLFVTSNCLFQDLARKQMTHPKIEDNARNAKVFLSTVVVGQLLDNKGPQKQA